jgi:hypothetical protein
MVVWVGINEGPKMVTRDCTDNSFAEKVRNDEEIPRNIKFHRQIMVETNTNNHLREKEHRIGFLVRQSLTTL